MKRLTHGQVDDDETAWCGGFVGGCLLEAEYAEHLPKNPLSARAYMEMPVRLIDPCVGAIIIFWRDSPSSGLGHVGFVAGKDQAGHLMVISGNHGDAVTCSPYSTDRLLGYRWPSISPLSERYKLPIIQGDGKLVAKES